MTVRDLIRASNGFYNGFHDEETERLCQLFELDRKKRFHELSMGNKKKVAVVCALAAKPKVLILDEPTNGLEITLAIMVLVTQLTINSLVKEERDGTIEFLYSKPISRRTILFQKTLANIFSFVFILIILCITTVIGYLSYSDYNFANSIKEAVIFYSSILYVGFFFMALGVLLSAVLKSSKSTSGIVIALVFGTFILGIMGLVIEDLSFLSYLSPMDWIKTQKLMTEGIKMEEWVIGIFTIIISYLLAHLMYNRKDLHS